MLVFLINKLLIFFYDGETKLLTDSLLRSIYAFIRNAFQLSNFVQFTGNYKFDKFVILASEDGNSLREYYATRERGNLGAEFFFGDQVSDTGRRGPMR